MVRLEPWRCHCATIGPMTLDEIFPAFGLEISCGPLRLRGLGTEDSLR